jgi:hypothetical protein
MHKITLTAVLLLSATLPGWASKIEGLSFLKDSQPTGTIDKEHKHKAYYPRFGLRPSYIRVAQTRMIR